MASRSFDKYFLVANAGTQSSYRAHIWLNDGNKIAGRLNFMREDLKPPNGTQHPDGLFDLYLPIGMLAPMLDVLRNEKPLHVVLEPNGTGGISMMPGFGEPVGEGE